MKNIDKQIFISFFKDGLADMFWGLFILSLGFNAMVSSYGLDLPLNLFIFIIPLGILYFLGKQYISKPRFGSVKSGEERKKKRIKILIIASVAQILIAFILWILMRDKPISSNFYDFVNPVTMFIFIVFLTSIIAYFSDYNRLYYVGTAIAFGWPLAEELDNSMGPVLSGLTAFGISGILIFVFGSFQFIKFLNKYPIPNKETKNVSI